MVNKLVEKSCNNWTLGLNGSQILNDEFCSVTTPKACYLELLNGLVNFSKLLKQGECSDISNRNEEIYNISRWSALIPNDVKEGIIGLPHSENFDIEMSTLNSFQFEYLKRTELINEKNNNSDSDSDYEIKLNFKLKPPEMNIDIKERKILSKDIDKKYKVENFQKDKSFENIETVIHLFIDQTSRDHFRRKLPKTFKFLEQGYSSNNNVKKRNEEINDKINSGNNKGNDVNYETFQFLKSQSAGPYTVINLIPIYFGLHMKNTFDYKGFPNNKLNFIDLEDSDKKEIKKHLNYASYFKNNDFILGQAYNYCSREIIDLEPDVMRYPYDNYDHEYIMCDPHYSMPGRPYSLIKGSYSYLKRCLYGKDTSYWLLEYGKKFISTYKGKKKFLRLGFQDGHEGTGEIVGYLDDLLVNFLEFLDFNNTAILLHSDHGLNMPGFYSGFEMEQFWIEKNTPFLYIILPKKDKKLEKLKINLKNNENSLVTALDINNTFKSLAGASSEYFNDEGSSLFYPILNKNERTCGKFRIKSEDCRCKIKD